jgi:hypothetical protein
MYFEISLVIHRQEGQHLAGLKNETHLEVEGKGGEFEETKLWG